MENPQNVNNAKIQMSTNSIVHEESCLSTGFAVIMNLCKEVMKVTTPALPSSKWGYNTIICSTILVGVLWCCILYHASLCSCAWQCWSPLRWFSVLKIYAGRSRIMDNATSIQEGCVGHLVVAVAHGDCRWLPAQLWGDFGGSLMRDHMMQREENVSEELHQRM